MINRLTYPFYKSIRFRFGVLFNVLLLIFLSAIILLLYGNVRNELDKNFKLQLLTGANTILQKTEINPVVIPLPQTNEFFLITYNNSQHTDTLFNNLPEKNFGSITNKIYKTSNLWIIAASKTFETGGVVRLLYALPSNDYNKSLQQLRTLLFIYIPVAIVLSFVTGYFLSGIFLKPIKNIIDKANQTDLKNDIKLLDEPTVADELHALTNALNRMLKRIEKQSRQQNAFFASASHELRTPLSNMLTELQTLNTQQLNSSTQKLVQNQLAEVQRLKSLVNNFLLMSQLKAQSIPLNKTIFNIAELTIEVVEMLQSSAKIKGQIFKVDMSVEDANFNICADKNHLAIILRNLLDNAVKYGKDNSVISIKISQVVNKILVQIQNETDNAVRNIESLSNEFMREDMFKEGFGLGLWISSQLSAINDGILKLEFVNKTFIAAIQFRLQQ